MRSLRPDIVLLDTRVLNGIDLDVGEHELVNLIGASGCGQSTEVLNIVRELSEEGITMLLATHEMSFAGEASSRVCFLGQGVIREQGPPEKIFSELRDCPRYRLAFSAPRHETER